VSRAPKTPYNFRKGPKPGGANPKPTAGTKKDHTPPKDMPLRRKPSGSLVD